MPTYYVIQTGALPEPFYLAARYDAVYTRVQTKHQANAARYESLADARAVARWVSQRWGVQAYAVVAAELPGFEEEAR